MNGPVDVRMVGGKIVVEIDVMRAIAEGMGGPKFAFGPKPGPKPAASKPAHSAS